VFLAKADKPTTIQALQALENSGKARIVARRTYAGTVHLLAGSSQEVARLRLSDLGTLEERALWVKCHPLKADVGDSTRPV
jgi:hypothetical protein